MASLHVCVSSLYDASAREEVKYFQAAEIPKLVSVYSSQILITWVSSDFTQVKCGGAGFRVI